MFIIDLTILGALTLAVVIGFSRGFVRQLLSLLSWVIALWIAFNFSGLLVGLFDPYLSEDYMRFGASFALLFVVSLMLVSVCSSLVHGLFLTTGLDGVDRTLGALCGLLIGALLVAVGIVLADIIKLIETSWWQQARLPQYFQPLVQLLYDLMPLMRDLLPPDFSASIFGGRGS